MPVQVKSLLLRFCGIPRANFLSRALPYSQAQRALQRFDRQALVCASTFLELPSELSPVAKQQLKLPFRLSGCGFRSVADSQAAAYWSSCVRALPDLLHLLPADLRDCRLPFMADLRAAHRNLVTRGIEAGAHLDPALIPETAEGIMHFYSSHEDPVGYLPPHLQRDLSHKILKLDFNRLIETSDQKTRARLTSVRSKFANAWMSTLPSDDLLTLSDPQARMGYRLYLGLPPSNSMPARCVCDALLAHDPDHYMLCSRVTGGGRIIRHDLIVKLLASFINMRGAIANIEPPSAHERPDIEVISHIDTELIDVSIIHPSASSFVRLAQRFRGAARHRERAKERKFGPLATQLQASLTPFVIDSYGNLDKKSPRLLRRADP